MSISHQDAVDAFKKWYAEAGPITQGRHEVRFFPHNVEVMFPDDLVVHVEYPGYTSTTPVGSEENTKLKTQVITQVVTPIPNPAVVESERVLDLMRRLELPVYPNTTEYTRPLLMNKFILKQLGETPVKGVSFDPYTNVLTDGDLTISLRKQKFSSHVATVKFNDGGLLGLHLEPTPALHFNFKNFSHVVPLEPLKALPEGVKTMKPLTPNERLAGSSRLPLPKDFSDMPCMAYSEITKAMAAQA
jgi:hypothetical protein